MFYKKQLNVKVREILTRSADARKRRLIYVCIQVSNIFFRINTEPIGFQDSFVLLLSPLIMTLPAKFLPSQGILLVKKLKKEHIESLTRMRLKDVIQKRAFVSSF